MPSSATASTRKTRPADAAGRAPEAAAEGPKGEWTFLTNHSHVLICLARDSEARLRDVAEQVGITERAAQRIVRDLEQAGVLTRKKEGRRNHYRIHGSKKLRHPVESDRRVRDLLEMVGVG